MHFTELIDLAAERLGGAILEANDEFFAPKESLLRAGDSLTCRFTFSAQLGEGSYSVATAIANSETHMTRNYEWRDLALVFQVVNIGIPPFVGTVYFPTTVQIERHTSHDAQTA